MITLYSSFRVGLSSCSFSFYSQRAQCNAGIEFGAHLVVVCQMTNEDSPVANWGSYFRHTSPLRQTVKTPLKTSCRDINPSIHLHTPDYIVRKDNEKLTANMVDCMGLWDMLLF